MINPLRLISETSQSPAMQSIVQSIAKIASSDLGILLVGEWGTGKEWLAHKIHQIGPRATSVFISVDCRTLTPDTIDRELFGQERLQDNSIVVEEGVLEEANSGTLFLDGFTSLSTDNQMKIARAVAHQKFHRIGRTRELWFNARVIIATTQRPDAETREGSIHWDILSRMSPLVIDIPPLRKRHEDQLALLNLFIHQTNDRYKTKVRGISPEALRLCLIYNWPGNIRELRNTVEFAVIMARDHLIQPAHLPLQVRKAGAADVSKNVFFKKRSVTAVEKFIILNALRRTSTKKDAARLLGISLRELRNKLEHYSLVGPSALHGGDRNVTGPGEQEENRDEADSSGQMSGNA